MKKIVAASILALGLAGCNATVYDSGYHRRPIASVYVTPAPIYVAPRRYVYNPYVYRVPPRCFTTWIRTQYGLHPRRICH